MKCTNCSEPMRRDVFGWLCQGHCNTGTYDTYDSSGSYTLQFGDYLIEANNGDAAGTDGQTELSRGKLLVSVPFVLLPFDDTFNEEAEKLFQRLLILSAFQ